MVFTSSFTNPCHMLTPPHTTQGLYVQVDPWVGEGQGDKGIPRPCMGGIFTTQDGGEVQRVHGGKAPWRGYPALALTSPIAECCTFNHIIRSTHHAEYCM